MENLRKVLEEISKDYKIDIEDALKKLEAYMNRILEKNQSINLTTITDKEEFVLKHLIDSLTAAKMPYFNNITKIVDIGTGAGFPGVPLAILFPDIEFCLVDAIKKKLHVIDEVCSELQINNVKTCHARAEDFGRDKQHREKYDLCLSRAVADLAILCEYCIPLIKPGGMFIAYKGPKSEEEKKRSLKAIKILGGEMVKEFKPEFAEFQEMEHRILIIKKIKHTPSEYPRKAGTPSKNPL